MVGLKPITKQCTKKILDQMENSFYTIKTNEGKTGIGCFCHIKYKKTTIPILITDIDLIIEDNKNEIKVYINNIFKTIKLYTRYKIKECNVVVIEIIVNEVDKINYLEIDDLLYQKQPEINYYNESIYTINCNNYQNISVTYDIIRNINNSDIIYYYGIRSKYKYSLIFNLSNNKIIGINKITHNNRGIFFNSIINEFNGFINRYESSKKNEI